MLPDFGWTELMVISIVLIIVIGPKDLPKLLRGFGQTMTSVRRMAGDFRKQFDDALKEAELDDVRQLADDMRALDPRSQIKEALNPLADAGREINADMKKAMGDLDAPILPKNPQLPKSAPQVGLEAAGDKARAAQANKRKPTTGVAAAKPSASDTAEPAPATQSKPAQPRAGKANVAAAETSSTAAARKAKLKARPAAKADGAAAARKTTATRKTAAKTKAAAAGGSAARPTAAKPRKATTTKKTTADDAGGSS